MTRASNFDRARGGTCLAAIPIGKKQLLCVDLLVEHRPPRRSPTVCVRMFELRPGMLPIPTRLRVSFDAKHLTPLIAGLRAAEDVLAAAVPISDAVQPPPQPGA